MRGAICSDALARVSKAFAAEKIGGCSVLASVAGRTEPRSYFESAFMSCQASHRAAGGAHRLEKPQCNVLSRGRAPGRIVIEEPWNRGRRKGAGADAALARFAVEPEPAFLSQLGHRQAASSAFGCRSQPAPRHATPRSRAPGLPTSCSPARPARLLHSSRCWIRVLSSKLQPSRVQRSPERPPPRSTPRVARSRPAKQRRPMA